MRRWWFLAAAAALALAGCASQAEPTPTVQPTLARPTSTPPPSATPFITATPADTAQAGYPGLPLPDERHDLFSTSGSCAPCHTRLTDDAGQDVSLDSAWRSTMMANAARDPYFLASVRREALRNPDSRQAIEDLCATCHMPMARFALAAAGQTAAILDSGLLDPTNELHTLAMDGVSCTLCHQIRETNLGPLSYSGRFAIDTELPPGQRLIFGPYTVDEDQAAIMQAASSFVPAQAIPRGRGLHLTQSELCATCHTLYVPHLDASGQVAGEFPEQVTYLEWFYSDYRSTSTCQACHMPAAEGAVRVAASSTTPRSPFTQHIFVGGNAYMLELLTANAQELGLTASAGQLETTRGHRLDQLQNQTASLALENVELTRAWLTLEVVVRSQVGHKFPSGFPSRRAWLHLVVTDASGQVVFESGAVNLDGSIVGNDADEDPSRYEPHYRTIVRPDQVQIYEAVLRDTSGRVTTDLMRAAGYLKDNRLLPESFEKGAPYPDIAVRGEAMEDENFDAGGDRVGYSINIVGAEAPFSVTVELLYQSIGYRWAQNFADLEGAEIERFLRFYDSVPNTAARVAEATTQVLP
ncbi:MAG: hypothetical protein AB1449_11815 [Chloroflexota bacterium]